MHTDMRCRLTLDWSINYCANEAKWAKHFCMCIFANLARNKTSSVLFCDSIELVHQTFVQIKLNNKYGFETQNKMALSNNESTSRFYAPLGDESDALDSEIEHEIASFQSGDKFSWIRSVANARENVSHLKFDPTVAIVDIPCVVCKGIYKNQYTHATHKNRFREESVCCICRVKFSTPYHLVAHARDYSSQSKCCLCGKRPHNFLNHITYCRNKAKKKQTESTKQKAT